MRITWDLGVFFFFVFFLCVCVCLLLIFMLIPPTDTHINKCIFIRTLTLTLTLTPSYTHTLSHSLKLTLCPSLSLSVSLCLIFDLFLSIRVSASRYGCLPGSRPLSIRNSGSLWPNLFYVGAWSGFKNSIIFLQGLTGQLSRVAAPLAATGRRPHRWPPALAVPLCLPVRSCAPLQVLALAS